ncbi:TetR/AcrR family transcriptional regulator [Streptomyces sp. CBMA156]|uniref:TetR/AcrR family transcriptional regulator n=1 Tax=Streptomyces sp. CBMA156 TaxID=1930280 RepID=UPI0016621759|nr:TetR/AcrR family transcriptional regulator [Streptomyces sp. CBMA156]MBD0674227.1 TetR family transcriptional regulator [Streptomyces sp. CBMA156]MBD0675179.1 TetR family transcriptional regulator [Streptomyces sp. CBMA156]
MATDRDTVLEAAVGVLSRRPTAHLDEIARAAGISRATLHRLFPGRDALIREVGLLGLRRFAAALDTAEVEEGDAEAALRRLVDAAVPDAMLCAFLAGENQLYEHDDINDLWEGQIARLHTLFLRGQQQGVFRIELSAAWLSEAFFDLVAGVGWSIQDGRLAPRDAAFSLAELFLGGALRRPDARTATPVPSAPGTTDPSTAAHSTSTHSTADHRPDTDKP